MDLTIGVVSDLHIGNSREEALNPSNYDNDQKSDLIKEFETLIQKEDIDVNYLLVPGDASDEAEPAQVGVASRFLTKILDIIDVDIEGSYFVPGNHDVDWSYLNKDDQTGHYRSQRFSAFEDDDYIFSTIDNRAEYSVYSCPYISLWSTDDLFIVGYNSAWDEGPNNAEPHHGLVDRSHLNEIDSILGERSKQDDKVKIFLVHHHPILYSSTTSKDFSAMQNGDRLIETLISHNFDMIIHGHKHEPRFKARSEGYGKFISILCAGSFSCDLKRWPRSVNNSFHTVNIQSRDEVTECITGKVKSWVYFSGNGWCRVSSNTSEIDFIEPFGTYIQEGRLVNIIEPIIERQLEAKDWVSWKDMCECDNRLTHVPNVQRRAVLQRVAGKLDIKFLDNESEFIILA